MTRIVDTYKNKLIWKKSFIDYNFAYDLVINVYYIA